MTQSLPRQKDVQRLGAAITPSAAFGRVGDTYIDSFFDFSFPVSKRESRRKLGIAGGAVDRLVSIQAKPAACKDIPAMQ